MGWTFFSLLIWAAALLFVPFHYWKSLWLVGLISVTAVYFIDSTLISLKAFSFRHEGLRLSGIPVPYLLSYIPISILFSYFRPQRRWSRLIYILSSAFILLVMELLMISVGYFSYNYWNVVKSYLLNTGGFTVFLWISEWAFNKRKKSTGSI